MRRTIAILGALLFAPLVTSAQVDVYFNREVDTTLAWPAGNIARGRSDFGAIVAGEIDAARRSVDVAIYSLSLPRVVDALLAARARGVAVRVIGHVENMEAGSGFARLAAEGVPVMANPRAPSGAQQPLMHDKLFVIDARPGAPPDADPRVVTGSWNATYLQTYADANNLIVLRDSAVAGAYLHEFEKMWGSAGELPDTLRATFGAAKEDDVDHDFTLRDGTRVELRFSPSDRTSSRIVAALGQARSSILFATLTVTYGSFVTALRRARDRGVEARGIIDNIDDQGSRFEELSPIVDLHAWPEEPLLHHKYAAIDALPFDAAAPAVVTGSHNWTLSAETLNDENTVIIHDRRIANLYLQEFAARYREAGGARPFVTTSAVDLSGNAAPPDAGLRAMRLDGMLLFQVPEESEEGEIILVDMLGRMIWRADVKAGGGVVACPLGELPAGMYGAILTCGGRTRSMLLHPP